MRHQSAFKVTLSLMLALLSTNIAYSENKDIIGYIKDKVYTNHYFRFSIPIPKRWSSKRSKLQDKVGEKVASMYFDFGGNKSNDDDLIDLLYLTTPYFYSNSVDIEIFAIPSHGIKSEAVFLNAMDEIYKESAKTSVSISKPEQRELGGRKVYHQQVSTRILFYKVVVEQYITLIKNHFLIMQATYITKSEQKLARKIMATIQFKDRKHPWKKRL